MRRFLSLSLFVLSLATPRASSAGAFVSEVACDTLSANPLRIFHQLIFFDSCGCKSLCDALLGPYSYQGSPIVPILGAVGSPTFSCSVDTLAGTATFTASPCLTQPYWHASDGFGVIVDAPNAYFRVTIHGVNGYIDPGFIFFSSPCLGATPAVPETWGNLKAAYR